VELIPLGLLPLIKVVLGSLDRAQVGGGDLQHHSAGGV
jgi:hypothetical protein